MADPARAAAEHEPGNGLYGTPPAGAECGEDADDLAGPENGQGPERAGVPLCPISGQAIQVRVDSMSIHPMSDDMML